jgi:hypothetical protein
MNIKSIILAAGMALATVSFTVYAEEDHLDEALKHAKEAAESTDGKTIAKHAELARIHAKTADEHLDAGIKSLDRATEQGNLGNHDIAKKAAEEAVEHLKTAE